MCQFILLDEVLKIHDCLISRYGGSFGLRDIVSAIPETALYQLALDVATSKVTKQEIAAILKKYVVQQ